MALPIPIVIKKAGLPFLKPRLSGGAIPLLNIEDYDFNMAMTALPNFLTSVNATYTRNSVKHVLQNGALVQLAANQFGTSFDSDPLVMQYGYLPETAATNLLTYSEEFNNAIWVKTFSTISANAGIAPDGTMTADKLIPDVTTGQHRVNYTTTSTAQAYSFSAYLKADGYNYAWLRIGAAAVYVDLTGTLSPNTALGGSNPLSIHIGNGWYRVSFNATAGVNDVVRINALSVSNGSDFAGDGTSGILVWGAQLETGTYASSYIKTAGATATRAADVLTVPLANVAGFNAAGYTMVVDMRQIVTINANRYFMSVTDGTSNNFSGISNLGVTDNLFRNSMTSGGIASVGVAETTVPITRSKFSSSFATNNVLRSVNSVAGTSDSVAVMPVSLSTCYIGGFNGSLQPNCYIFNAKLIITPITQSQLNAVTTL